MVAVIDAARVDPGLLAAGASLKGRKEKIAFIERVPEGAAKDELVIPLLEQSLDGMQDGSMTGSTSSSIIIRHDLKPDRSSNAGTGFSSRSRSIKTD